MLIDLFESRVRRLGRLHPSIPGFVLLAIGLFCFFFPQALTAGNTIWSAIGNAILGIFPESKRMAVARAMSAGIAGIGAFWLFVVFSAPSPSAEEEFLAEADAFAEEGAVLVEGAPENIGPLDYTGGIGAGIGSGIASSAPSSVPAAPAPALDAPAAAAAVASAPAPPPSSLPVSTPVETAAPAPPVEAPAAPTLPIPSPASTPAPVAVASLPVNAGPSPFAPVFNTGGSGGSGSPGVLPGAPSIAAAPAAIGASAAALPATTSALAPVASAPAVASASAAAAAVYPAPAVPPTPQQLAPADLLLAEAGKWWDKGKIDVAIVTAQKALELYRRLLGDQDPKVAQVRAMIEAAKAQKVSTP